MRHMRHRTKVEDLVRYIVSISVIGTGFTVLLDMLANAAEAPATVRALVIHGSAGVFAYAGVALYRAIEWRTQIEPERSAVTAA
jgi:hypothetical protein